MTDKTVVPFYIFLQRPILCIASRHHWGVGKAKLCSLLYKMFFRFKPQLLMLLLCDGDGGIIMRWWLRFQVRCDGHLKLSLESIKVTGLPTSAMSLVMC